MADIVETTVHRICSCKISLGSPNAKLCASLIDGNERNWLGVDRKNKPVSLPPQAGPLLELRQGRFGQKLIPQAVARRSSNAALAVLLQAVCGLSLMMEPSKRPRDSSPELVAQSVEKQGYSLKESSFDGQP